MATNPPKLLFLMTLSCTIPLISSSQSTHFLYNGFQGTNLHLDGIAKILQKGLLELTNSSKQQKGHAFYPHPIRLSASPMLSTTFVFAMLPQALPDVGGHGMAFVASSSMDFNNTLPNEQLGLFNNSNNGLPSNRVFAVELDTVQSPVFGDIDSNHLGIDVNSLNSTEAASAGYYSDKRRGNVSLNLLSGRPMQVWIDYDARKTVVEVGMAPLGVSKPSKLLLSARVNLSEVLVSDTFYVGFSAATGTLTGSHYLIGWSFSQGGQADNFDVSKLPQVPRLISTSKKFNDLDIVLLSIVSVFLATLIGLLYRMRRIKYEEVMEDWEKEYAIQRFSYKDLYTATKGFKELLGAGGFGKVYKGVLPQTMFEVAIKRVSHDSRQGMKEFVAEIASMRRLRHRNLVPLLGYCRRKGELILVYEYMPNGSLDKLLFDKEKPTISWVQRLKIIKGVASALCYLHEEWEQVVLHRDVKASNILLDNDMEARLGDFGLARLYDHGTNPQTTHVVGTVGYLAPELPKTGKATTRTDVFSFGTFVLEVACGRRPIGNDCSPEEAVLVDWVHDCWMREVILKASDLRLEGNYTAEDMARVLKLGLLCSHPRPEERPSMRQAMQFLNGDPMVPDLPIEFADIGSFNQSSTTSSSWISEKTFSSYSHSTNDPIV